MSRILITGSSTGLGLHFATHLLKTGQHHVILHARNQSRANDIINSLAHPPAPDKGSYNLPSSDIVVGDLSTFSSTIALAAQINEKGPFDVVIHNAGVLHGGFRKTSDGIPLLTATNTFSTYILACLISPIPQRTVILSSGLHKSGDTSLKDLTWQTRGESQWNDIKAYSDSKLHDVLLAKAFSRIYNDIASQHRSQDPSYDDFDSGDRRRREGVGRSTGKYFVNAMDPGWIPTRMGGSNASGSWERAVETYNYLAFEVGSSGGYWMPGAKEGQAVSVCDDEGKQEELLRICEGVTGVKVPRG